MKKVLLLFFLVLFLTCAREAKNVAPSSPITTIDSTSTAPKESVVDPVEIGKVKVYIENTLSMYGYLPKKSVLSTDFRNAVNELLIESKNSYDAQNVELLLVNNKTSKSVNIDNNLDKIDEGTLRSLYKDGNQSSDFDKLFKNILKDWEQDEIVVFIADFIYSPPPKETDVISGLVGLRQNITDAFQKGKNLESLAVNILHLESKFQGTYYDIKNESKYGIKNRPYYIFILGSEKNVKTYSKQVVPQLERYNLKNEYHLTPSSTAISDYSALPFTLNQGQFDPNSSSINTSQIRSVTVKNSLKHSANVQLAISLDLRPIQVSDEYLMNINNYVLSDNKIKLIDIGKIDDKHIKLSDGSEAMINPSDISYSKNATHVFLLSFPSTYKGDFELSLKKNMPNWVEEVSIDHGEDDIDIKTNVLKQSQTFGFNYIVEGIYNAQANSYPENEYFQLTFNIDQEKSGSGLGIIFGWFVGLGIIFVIIVIIIRNKQRK